MNRIALIFALALLALMPRHAGAAELVMAEQAGCEWCEAWDSEIGIVYNRTREGRIAPLRRVDIHDPLPRDLEFIRGLVFTPTFVLIDGGEEIGRINGYPGEDFFWGLLQQLIEKLPGQSSTEETTRIRLGPAPGLPSSQPTRG